MGKGIESKLVSLTKQNDPKQNYSSPASLKYKPRVLIAANNLYITTRKKIFAAFSIKNVKSTVKWYKCRRVVLSHKPVYLGIV